MDINKNLSSEEQYSLNKGWSWKKSPKGMYLQSISLKEYGFEHGFFTKEWSGSDPNELVKNINNNLSAHSIKQVHSSKVINSYNALHSPWPEADGLVSDKKNESLWIYSADCIPILFADSRRHFCGACHAGWRGIANEILLKVIKKLETIGSKRKDLIIALGPAISEKNYQVDLNVAESIFKSLFTKKENSFFKVQEKIEKMISLGIINYDSQPNKYLLDLRASAAKQLYQSGLKESQISISNLCTYSNQPLFNSWRRDKAKNRQWSMIATSF